jgi:hypothetical protein
MQIMMEVLSLAQDGGAVFRTRARIREETLHGALVRASGFVRPRFGRFGQPRM